MKKLLKERLSRTSKSSINRIYLDDKKMVEAGFGIGDICSYVVDFKKHTVRIVSNESLSTKTKISRKKKSNQMIPIIDLNNRMIREAFEGINQCKITIFEDEIIISGIVDEIVGSTSSQSKFSQLCGNVISFAKKKREREVSIRLKRQALDEMLLKKGEKIASGQISLFETGFSLSEDSVTQSYAQTETFKEQLPLLTKTLKVLSLFSGCGAFEEALKNLGVNHEVVNYCEFNPMVAKAYSLIHNIDPNKNLGDVTKVDEKKLAEFDLMTWGFPCQDISSLGNQKGLFNKDGSLTRSGLFFEAIRIAKHNRPRFMIVENVRALIESDMKEQFSHMLALLDDIGYNTYYEVANSVDFEIPQSRRRVFIVCIRKDADNHRFAFPKRVKLLKKASDLYDPADIIEDECYVGPNQYKYFNEERLKKKYSSLNSEILICMTTKQGNVSSPQNFVKDERGYRILSMREMFRFQGFKSRYGDLLKEAGYKLSQVGYMMGNTITVNVVQAILKNLLKSSYSLSIV